MDVDHTVAYEFPFWLFADIIYFRHLEHNIEFASISLSSYDIEKFFKQNADRV